MWRAGNNHDDFLEDPEEFEGDPAHAPNQVTSPHSLSLGDPGFAVMNVAEPTWESWRENLSRLGGVNPLLHFTDSPLARIELSTTHPGGLAQFITGKTTLLSSLIRDDVALRAAKLAAGVIAAKSRELSTTRGIDSIHLGIGVAEWQFDGEDFRAPILLRPLAIRRFGNDFELRLRGEPKLNPSLAEALEKQHRIVLDARGFVALAEKDGSFKPNPVIDRLRGLTRHLEWFNVQPRLVVSSFADIATALVKDATNLEHPVLDAIAGNPSATWALGESHVPTQVLDPDSRAPETDTLLLDADSEQEEIVAHISAGNSVVVKTLPGTGGTQTIVNAIGALVQQNKRVLVVSPRQASLHGIVQRISDIGLQGMPVAPGTLRRDIIRAIGRNEKAQAPRLGEVDEALVRLRTVLVNYRKAVSHIDPELGVSVLDCLTELSRLALLPTPPATTARLSRSSVSLMVTGREKAADAMIKAASLGEFKYGPGDSAWYGASFSTSDEATRAHGIAQQLCHIEVPRLLQRASELLATTRMRPFESIEQLGVYLRLLTDIRDSLDKFLPVVFERSLSELIAATGSRKDSAHMTATNRRRMRKLAREYQRPGAHVGDINEALRRIQQQRFLWQRFSAEGITPHIPVGIADVQVAHQQVMQALAALDAPLGTHTTASQLAALPIRDLLAKLAGLAEESDALSNLQERTELLATLRELDVDPLLADLASRHVPESQVAAELELAWWRSALESLLENDRALLGANTEVLDRLEADFRLVDETHASGSAALLGWQLAENWSVGLTDWPDEAAALKALLRGGEVTSRSLQEAAPHLSRSIAPVWIASPYEIPEIADSLRFDAVLLVDAGAVTVAESVGAIRRAKQVVAFGDPVTQTPSDFELSLHESEPIEHTVDELEELHANSALSTLGKLLPTLALTRSYRAGGEDLAELVNRRFYAGRIESIPWAGSFLGHGSISIDFIEDGKGMPDPTTGAVESVDAEVDRVVELVMSHAAQRPHESLMVITASPLHAVRVQQAVLLALSTRPELHDFILGDRAEPFLVATIEQAVAESRDRVIFSIGYGRTPHGRVLSDFGALGRPGGERMLAAAMTRARRAMVIVTCFEASDIDEDRMQFGAVALADVLTDVKARTRIESIPDDSNPMLVDLSRRLEARGLRTALGHRNKLGLVAHHEGKCLAIETDAVLQGMSLRESLRLRPEQLRRLGWHYLRVHAFELFSHPNAVADRVVALLGANPAPATEPIPFVMAAQEPDGGGS